MSDTAPLEIRVLGPLEVLRDGIPLILPPSRKTRALLAYLACSGRPQRRERLCDMFWDVPDDPRGALRWSLSKLRPILDSEQHQRLVADRATVRIDCAGLFLDRAAFDEGARTGFGALSTETLESLANAVRGAFLEDLSLSRCEEFEAWRHAESLAIAGGVTKLLGVLVERLHADPERALRHVARLRGLAHDVAAVDAYVARLNRSLQGRPRDIPHERTESVATDRRDAAPSSASSAWEAVPLLAVLPFDNLAGDPAQNYLSDGITEDLITELSRFRSLRLIARNSVFVFKGRPVQAQEIGSVLGASYMVEGSVRKAGNRVRVTAQLIETATGSHLWAERYDRDLADILTLQEEIARTIAAAIEPELGSAERRRAGRKPSANLTAWDRYQHGVSCMYAETRAGNREALAHLEQSMKLDPAFAPAHAAAAYVHFNDIIYGYRELTLATIREAFDLAERAVLLDDRDAMAHLVLGRLQLLRLNHADSIAELETAIALNPSYADAHHGLGFTLTFSGRPEDAVPRFDAAIALSPYDPRISSFHEMRAWALLASGRAEEALADAKAAVRRPGGDFWEYATLCAVLGHLGRPAEAAAAREALLERKPDFSARFVREYVFYNKIKAHLDYYVEGLMKAGLPADH